MTKAWTIATLFMLVACGDEPQAQKQEPKAETKKAEPKAQEAKAEEPKEEAKAEEPKEEASAVTINAAGEAEVTIEGSDAMQYNVKTFSVTAGQKVKLTLKHTGQLPKASMGHNIIILKPDVDLMQFVTAAQKAADNDYFPKDKADQAIAHSKLIGGGESVTIEFVAPEPGTYKYICSFASHYFMMQGDMVVVAK